MFQLRHALLLFLLSIVGMSRAQRPVESGPYNLMLKTLLSHSVPEISVAEAQGMIEDAVFLDSREREEFSVSRIPGAIFVGYDDFEMERVEAVDKHAPIVVYCAVGYRSEKVSERLLEAGYTNVQNLYGGIFEWKNQGHTVVDSTGAPTERVHAYSRSWGIWLNEGEKVY